MAGRITSLLLIALSSPHFAEASSIHAQKQTLTTPICQNFLGGLHQDQQKGLAAAFARLLKFGLEKSSDRTAYAERFLQPIALSGLPYNPLEDSLTLPSTSQILYIDSKTGLIITKTTKSPAGDKTLSIFTIFMETQE